MVEQRCMSMNNTIDTIERTTYTKLYLSSATALHAAHKTAGDTNELCVSKKIITDYR
jgi:hypothetical protein